MRYFETHTYVGDIAFVETISQEVIDDKSITFDTFDPSSLHFDVDGVAVWPIRSGKVIKTYLTTDAGGSDTIYLVQIFDVVRLVYGNKAFTMPSSAPKIGDAYRDNHKKYTIQKIYKHQMLIEDENGDNARLVNLPSFAPVVRDDVLKNSTIVMLARILKERGLNSQLLSFIDIMNYHNK